MVACVPFGYFGVVMLSVEIKEKLYQLLTDKQVGSLLENYQKISAYRWLRKKRRMDSGFYIAQLRIHNRCEFFCTYIHAAKTKILYRRYFFL